MSILPKIERAVGSRWLLPVSLAVLVGAGWIGVMPGARPPQSLGMAREEQGALTAAP